MAQKTGLRDYNEGPSVDCSILSVALGVQSLRSFLWQEASDKSKFLTGNMSDFVGIVSVDGTLHPIDWDQWVVRLDIVSVVTASRLTLSRWFL